MQKPTEETSNHNRHGITKMYILKCVKYDRIFWYSNNYNPSVKSL